jgi:hypothetical protein
LKKSYDFLGLTLYTAKYARDNGDPNGWWVITEDKNGRTIGEQVGGHGDFGAWRGDSSGGAGAVACALGIASGWPAALCLCGFVRVV